MVSAKPHWHRWLTMAMIFTVILTASGTTGASSYTVYPVGVTLGADGEPLVLVELCSESAMVTSVEVTPLVWEPDPEGPLTDESGGKGWLDRDEAGPVWRIELTGASTLDSFTVGEAPLSYTQVTPPAEALDPEQPYVARAFTGNSESPIWGATFTPSTLRPDQVYSTSGYPQPADEFRERVRRAHCGPWWEDLWRTYSPVLFLGGVVGAVLLVARIVRGSRRKASGHLPPPPVPSA